MDNHSYKKETAAKAFRVYADSKNALIEQDFLYLEIKKILEESKKSKILDAACGTGWLSERLFVDGHDVSACDISPILLDEVRKKCPAIRTAICDMGVSLPYDNEEFDVIIVNMSLHDFSDLEKAFQLLYQCLKKNGRMIISVANPYYSHPVGRWKRGFFRRILGKKPLLRLFPYNFLKRCEKRSHVWNEKIPSYFYTLEEYIEAAISAGLSLQKFKEIVSEKDAQSFNRTYQFFRFPMILLMVFEKK